MKKKALEEFFLLASEISVSFFCLSEQNALQELLFEEHIFILLVIREFVLFDYTCTVVNLSIFEVEMSLLYQKCSIFFKKIVF